MVDEVSPSAQKPKHHVTLSDGTTTVGLIAVKQWSDKQGEIITAPDENQIRVDPSQPLAIQTSQGNSEYSDREWPYMTLEQKDWSGGRGSETFEDDRSRYFDGYRVNTWREGELLLGGMATYTKYDDEETYMPGDASSSGVTWSDLYGSSRYWSTVWTQDGTWYCDQIVEVYVRKIGSPGTLTVRIADNSGGDPDATLIIGTDTGSTLNVNESYLLQITMDGTYELQDTTDYHIEAYGAAADDSDDHWEIGTATGTTGGQYNAGDVIVNGGFDTDSNWDKTDFSITGGKAVAVGAGQKTIAQTGILTSGVEYSVKYTVSDTAPPPEGEIYVRLGGTAGTTRTADGTYTESITSNAANITFIANSDFTGKIDDVSATPTAYTGNQPSIYYRILKAYTPATKTQTRWTPFEYKGAQYAYTQPPSGDCFLHINADRGVHNGTFVASRLTDEAKSWADDLYNGAVVVITAGPGSEETQPWRNITDTVNNTNNPYLTVSPDWNVTHTTATEYVIVKDSTMSAKHFLGGFVTDYVVTEDYIYFARGETASLNILRYRRYNNSGSEAQQSAIEANVSGKYLLSIHHPEHEFTTLYIAQNDHPQYGVAVGKMKIPGTWNDLVFPMGQLAYTNTPWADRDIDHCTQTTDDQATNIALTNSFETGLIAVQNLTKPVDITRANKLGLWIKSDTTIANDRLYLQYDDFVDNDGFWFTGNNVIVNGTFDLGGEELANVSFDSSAAWVPETNWTVPGDGAAHCDGGQTGTTDVYQSAVLEQDKVYRVTFTVGSRTAGGVTPVAGNDEGVKREGNSPYIDFVGSTSADTNFYFRADTNFDGDITICSCKESGWFGEGDYWNIPPSVGYLVCDGTQSGNTDMYQPDILTTGTLYKVTYTITVYNAGEVKAICGTTEGRARSATGTFTEYLSCSPANTTFYLRGNATFDGRIDDVSVQPITGEPDYLARTAPPAMVTHFDDTNGHTKGSEALDGDSSVSYWDLTGAVAVTTDDWLYVLGDMKFTSISFDFKVPNTVGSILNAEYYAGSGWYPLTITDGTALGGATFGQDGDITFTAPQNWKQFSVGIYVSSYSLETYTGYPIRLRVSVTLDDPVEIYQIATTRSNQVTLDIDALTADEWTYKVIDITPEKFPAPDDTQVQSLGLSISTDLNANINIMMRGGIDLLYDEPDWKPLPSNDLITNMVAHNGNVQEPRTNPWIFTEGAEIYEMQSQNEDQFIPVTIGEMGALRSEHTGSAACVNDVYLYFSLGEEKLERWFNNSLEDVGPDLGAGLPSSRLGRITALLSYPGRVYAAVSDPDNNASILVLRGSSWHEVYRAPRAEAEIKNMYHQVIPGDTVGRLWFDQGGDILWIPVTAGDPREASSYEFTHEGRLETGWFYGGMKDIIKIWNELKCFAENVGANYYVEADYKVDGDSSWTVITGTFDTEPSEALDIASTMPNNKRMKYRLRLYSKLAGDTPEIKAMLLDCYGVVPIKYVYTLPIVVADKWQEKDLQGNDQKALGYTDAASTAITKLRSWASGGTPLTLHSNVAAMDDSTIVLQGPPLKPIRINNKDQEEKYLLNVTCRDV